MNGLPESDRDDAREMGIAATRSGRRHRLAYAVDEVAALLGLSRSTVRTLVQAGTLPRVLGLGRSVRIPSHAVYELVGEPVPPLLEMEASESPASHAGTPTRSPALCPGGSAWRAGR